jgi:hypothetical protein
MQMMVHQLYPYLNKTKTTHLLTEVSRLKWGSFIKTYLKIFFNSGGKRCG